VRQHVDLDEFSNNVKGLTTRTSANKKVDAVVEIVHFFVDQGLDLLVFVDVLLLLGDISVDCVGQTETRVRVVWWRRIRECIIA
jgi:hypothetical protein